MRSGSDGGRGWERPAGAVPAGYFDLLLSRNSLAADGVGAGGRAPGPAFGVRADARKQGISTTDVAFRCRDSGQPRRTERASSAPFRSVHLRLNISSAQALANKVRDKSVSISTRRRKAKKPEDTEGRLPAAALCVVAPSGPSCRLRPGARLGSAGAVPAVPAPSRGLPTLGWRPQGRLRGAAMWGGFVVIS